MTLADRIATVILEHGPMAECHIATAVGKRKEDVSAELEGNPRFVHNGRKARASRWSILSFDVASAAEHFGVSVELAEEFLVGPEGFVERGFVMSLNGGGGPFVITELGRKFAGFLEASVP